MKVKDHVLKLRSDQLSEDMIFHSTNHTLGVVKSVNELASEQQFDEEEIEWLNIAAWFHDLGYFKGNEDHEEEGAKLASKFLLKNDYPVKKINQVVACILGTSVPQPPKNNLEHTLCEADLMYLAGNDYFNKMALLHEEIQKTKSWKTSEEEWLKTNEKFLNNYCFFTDYAKFQYELAVKEKLEK